MLYDHLCPQQEFISDRYTDPWLVGTGLLANIWHIEKGLKKFKVRIAVYGNPSQSYRALPAARRMWMHQAVTPARQAGTRFTYPKGWKAELT